MGNDYARFLGIGFTLMAAIGVPAGVGFLVDRMLGTVPLFLLIGLGVGFAAGMYFVYLQVNKLGEG